MKQTSSNKHKNTSIRLMEPIIGLVVIFLMGLTSWLIVSKYGEMGPQCSDSTLKNISNDLERREICRTHGLTYTK
jgi:hypothetical protein